MFIIRFTITMIVMLIIMGIADFLINGINRVKTGIVVDKTHSAGYMPNGPDIYMLAIRGTKRGKTVIYWKTVTRKEYCKYDINDQYP